MLSREGGGGEGGVQAKEDTMQTSDKRKPVCKMVVLLAQYKTEREVL